MSELQMIALVGSLGVLVYLVFGYRSFRETSSKTMLMAGIWIGIFALAIIIFAWFLT